MSNTNFRPEEENEEQYIHRICSMKDSSGMTWKEIANIINKSLNKNYTEIKGKISNLQSQISENNNEMTSLKNKIAN